MDKWTEYSSPVGRLTLCTDGAHLTGLWLEGQKYFGYSRAEEARADALPLFADVRAWLDRYFSGERPLPGDLPLRPGGSAFQQRVWKLLCEIPYGGTTTYGGLAGRLAEELGRETMSSQAVGGAVGRNPISIIIPCHRVVGWDGRLTGYAGGLTVKKWLLDHEGAELTGHARKG